MPIVRVARLTQSKGWVRCKGFKEDEEYEHKYPPYVIWTSGKARRSKKTLKWLDYDFYSNAILWEAFSGEVGKLRPGEGPITLKITRIKKG